MEKRMEKKTVSPIQRVIDNTVEGDEKTAKGDAWTNNRKPNKVKMYWVWENQGERPVEIPDVGPPEGTG